MSFSDKKDGLPLYPVKATDFEQWLSKLAVVQQKWVKAAGFKAKEGELCALPDSTGKLSGYAFGMAQQGWLNQLAPLPEKLPANCGGRGTTPGPLMVPVPSRTIPRAEGNGSSE